METRKRKRLSNCSLTAAVIAAAIASTVPSFAGQNAGEITISASGSTALKNWFVSKTTTFTDVTPGTQISIGGVNYPASLGAWSTNNGSDGNAIVYQIAPGWTNPTTPAAVSNSGLVQQANAVRFEYHESGSVEGIVELANDQIAPISYVTQNIDRNPTLSSTSGNNVWVNYQQYGSGAGSWTTTNSPVGSSIKNGLGNFYPGTLTFVLGSNSNPTPVFDLAGNNTSVNSQGISGQNAVQLAVSDVIPAQAFVSNSTTDSAAHPWQRTPSDAGYGTGNTNLPSGTLGSAKTRSTFLTNAALNMPANAINPRTGAVFGSGDWNTGGLNNLNSQLVATTATLFVANPGTGLSQLNKTDAQWLQLQSRLQNGATFNMATRDVNSGTRNVAASETGIDPTWASGMNDTGNGNAADAGTSQIAIGPGLRFSNKTAGGGQLRPTVQSARMAVGTLSINDANGNTFSTNSNPLRALSYANTFSNADGSRPASTYVAPSYVNIISGAYSIFQNEQFVTLKRPDGTYNNTNPQNINVQGDSTVNTALAASGTASGDVLSLMNNTLNSVKNDIANSSPASPAAGLMSQGYILPQLMEVRKSQNGKLYTFTYNGPTTPDGALVNGQTYTNVPFIPNSTDTYAGVPGVPANQAYNPAAVAAGALTSTASSGKMANDVPTNVTSGQSSSVYGGNSVTANGPAGFNQKINLTASNYLFGNFNQNGVRDFAAAVVSAQQAQLALENGSANVTNPGIVPTASAFTGELNNTKIQTGIAALDNIQGQHGDNSTTAGLSKGDLIVLGDYNGDGVFDGKDLYSMAFGASLADAGNAPVFTNNGATYSTGGTISGGAANFGQNLLTAVLYKNAALNYLNKVATTAQKTEAAVNPLDAGSIANAFNPADVNHDGKINIDDALIVDKFAGQSYTDQTAQMQATINVNGTIDLTGGSANQQPISLVAATLVDYGTNNPTINKIQQGDADVLNTALTGVFNYNWYNGETKVGGLTVSASPTAGSVIIVPAGATFTVAAGTFKAGGSVDVLTDSTSTGADTTKSLAVTITRTGKLEYAAANTGGIHTYKLASLNVQTGTTAVLDTPTNHANRNVLVVGSLSFGGSADAWGGQLDLGGNDLIVHNGDLATLTNQIKSGMSFNFLGQGIASQAAHDDANHLLGIGVVQNVGGFLLTFDGQPSTASDVLVKTTYFGDANLSGNIDGSDYSLIDNGFNLGLSGWINGDFNYDGHIDGGDYSLIDNAYNSSVQNANPLAITASMVATPSSELSSSATAVPEPGALGVGVICCAGLLLARRTRRR